MSSEETPPTIAEPPTAPFPTLSLPTAPLPTLSLPTAPLPTALPSIEPPIIVPPPAEPPATVAFTTAEFTTAEPPTAEPPTAAFTTAEPPTHLEILDADASPPAPPPKHPPIPPPPETKLWDHDLIGYAGAGILIANGIMTGMRGGMMIEAGVLPGGLAAWAANRHSKAPSNAYFGTLTWVAITSQYALLAYMKKPTFLPASVLGVASLGMSGRFYYKQMLNEMEKEKDDGKKLWTQ